MLLLSQLSLFSRYLILALRSYYDSLLYFAMRETGEDVFITRLIVSPSCTCGAESRAAEFLRGSDANLLVCVIFVE